jgi:single-strand DNA-binding protein
MSASNLVVLRGTLSADVRQRELPSGQVLAQFDVTTRDDDGAHTVPVAWFDPPASAGDLRAGAEVVVTGTVRRRFFRAGGATQSRTEVVAQHVALARRGRDVRRLIEGALRPWQVGEVAMVAAG